MRRRKKEKKERRNEGNERKIEVRKTDWSKD